MNRKKLFLIFILGIFLIGMVSSATISSSRTTSLGSTSVYSGQISYTESGFEKSMCQEGQDFVIQITPGSCSPSVVRSDLLEEEDVHVFCEVRAFKINPLIDVEGISKISFASDYPQGVRTINFYPNYELLGTNEDVVGLNNLNWEEVGYVEIVLKQESNESAMQEFISGNLTAKLTYDLENAFGLRRNEFYLPVMSDTEFDFRYGQYAFFNQMGFLRAEDVTSDSASLSFYTGRYQSAFSRFITGENSKQRFGSLILNEGETSSEFYLPGFECLTGVKFTLEDITYSDTIVRVSVDSEVFEVREGQSFLNDKCSVVKNSLVKNGLNQNVQIKCQQDDKSFFTSSIEDFSINPKVILQIDGNVGEFSVGDKLYDVSGSTDSVYLGYIDTIENSEGGEDLEAIIAVLPSSTGESLSQTDLDLIACEKKKETGVGTLACRASRTLKDFFEGGKLKDNTVTTSKDIYVGTKKIKILSLGDGANWVISNEDISDYYQEAIEDYDEIFTSYKDEVYPVDETITLGEKSLYEKIKLADKLYQKLDVNNFCNDFLEEYPDTSFDTEVCMNDYYFANGGKSFSDLLIEGELRRIQFEGIQEPSFEDYGVTFLVKAPGEEDYEEVELNKGESYYFGGLVGEKSSSDFIRLEEILEDDTVKVYLGLEAQTGLQSAKDALVSSEQTLKLDKSTTVRGYSIIVKKINFNRVAHVSVQPTINNAGSEVDFSFGVGIEKRAIQLSPEKAMERAEKLNDTIHTMGSISSHLGTVVEGLETVCIATGTVLTAKNILFGSNGATIAREEVMRGEGGWYERCNYLISKDPEYEGYSVEKCLLENAEKIDSEVDEIVALMEDQNTEISELQKLEDVLVERSILDGGNVVDTDALTTKYSEIVYGDLSSLKKLVGDEFENPSKGGEKINLDTVLEVLNANGVERGIYDIDNLKEIDLYYDLYFSETDSDQKTIYEKRLYTAISRVANDIKDESTITGFRENYGASSSYVGTFNKKTNELPLSSNLKFSESKSYTLNKGVIGDSEFVFYFKELSNGNEYLLVYEIDGSVSATYELGSSGVLNKLASRNPLNIVFKKYDKAAYKNPYIETPEVRYYETEPYKGMPAVVPFDTKNGWYAYVKQSIPTLSDTRVYDDSGRASSFWLCNIGENGLEDFSEGRGEDDICQQINLNTNQAYNQFSGLDTSEASSLITKAVNAINDARENYKDGGRNVNILGESVNVGSPAVDTSSSQCEDFMSPTDCQIMFNACDPVICPTDRCDLNGKYPVRDVIQSGIVGSIALCLPNYNEGIYIPVCLTGLKAGLDSFTSVVEAYRDCLETSATTGETVGICDQMHSIYMCEFLWKQTLPIAKYALPNILSAASGEVRGGGTYSNFAAAFENAKDSVNFFTQQYAVNAYTLFKAKSQEEIGGEVCKGFVSTVFPTGQGFLEALTESQSPPQFSGSFEEISYTSATVPPVSHYKVYYHIYAGESQGAYYQVYLKGGSSSYYQDTGSGRVVASGYISAGDYASETEDFSAVAGYDEMCIVVNNYEECGFGTVTTSFAADYLKDSYIQNQVNNTDIQSEKECISGSTSLYSLLNLNLQSGVESLIDPEIYNSGITRVCATDNPGLGSDIHYGTSSQRWVEVGTCDDEGTKCWLDRDGLEEAFEFEYSWNQTEEGIQEYVEKQLAALEAQGEILSDDDFELALLKIENENDLKEKVTKIESIFFKVVKNAQRAYLTYLKGGAFGDLANNLFETVELPKIIELNDYSDIEDDLDISDSYEEVNKLDIYSRIQASDYESPAIFITSYGDENLFLQYSGGEWNFRGYREVTFDDAVSSLKKVEEGSIELNGVHDFENEGFQTFLDRLLDLSYVGGINLLLDNSGKENLEYSIEDLISAGGDILMDENKNFKVLLGDDEVYFKFSGDEWLWSIEKDFDKWEGMEDNYQDYSSYSWWYKLYDFVGIGDSATTFIFPEEYRGLKVALLDKDEEEGILILLEGSEFWNEVGSVYVQEDNYDSLISSYASQYGISASLLKAVIKQESNFNPYAVSSTGAAGLMQFTSSTAGDFSDIFGDGSVCTESCSCSINCDRNDVEELCGCSLDDGRFSSTKSINAGAKYLSQLISRYDSYEDKEKFALAAYNGGMGVIDYLIDSLEDNNIEVNWENAENYLNPSVLSNFDVYRSKSSTFRENKVEEIKNYVSNIYSSMEEITLGGNSYEGEISSEVKSMLDNLYLMEYRNSINNVQLQAMVSELLDSGRMNSNEEIKFYSLDEGIDRVNYLEEVLEQVILGEKIYSIAKGFSDSGYNQVREDGSLDNACASFVSTVLYDVGVRMDGFERGTGSCVSIDYLVNLFSSSNQFETLERVDSSWEGVLKKGDVVVFGLKSMAPDKTQHSSIFSYYSDDLSKAYVYSDPGSSSNVKLGGYPIEGSDWYISYAFRYIGALESSEGQTNEDNVEEGVVDSNEEDSVSEVETSFGFSSVQSYQTAIDYIDSNGLSGKYSDTEENKAFVDYLYKLGLITEDELDEIDGWWLGGEEDMAWVKDLLNEKYELSLSYLQLINEGFEENWDEIYSAVKENHNLVNVQDKDGLNILHYAVFEKSFLNVNFLVEWGAGINAVTSEGKTVLDLSYEREDDFDRSKIISYLEEKGAVRGTVVEKTVKENYEVALSNVPIDWDEIVQLLSEDSSLVNVRSSNGDFAIHLAVSEEDLDLVKNLVETGAGINYLDSEGNTPLDYAVYLGNDDIINYLRDKGALTNGEL